MSNPYENEYLLPIPEIRRMLLTYRVAGRKFGGAAAMNKNKISLYDIHKETKVKREMLNWIMDDGVPSPGCKASFGPVLQRRLSRFLIRAACGMIEKRDGQIIYNPEPTKPMPVVRRVSLSLVGPPKMMAGVQMEKPRSMPKFIDLFKTAPTINLPKGLR